VEQESTNTPGVTSDDAEKPLYPALRSLNLVPVALVLYILSVGPAAKVCSLCNMPGKYPKTEATLEAIYKPIDSLASYPPAARFLTWYIEKIWRVDLLKT
jgi:hypothetical protein